MAGEEMLVQWTSTPQFWEWFITLGFIALVFLFVALLAMYIFTSLALMTIAKKLKVKNPWLAWIPIANFYLLTQTARVSGWWTLILLAGFIPWIGGLAVLGFSIWFLWIVSERRKFPGPLSLLTIIPAIGYMIVVGILAWAKK